MAPLKLMCVGLSLFLSCFASTTLASLSSSADGSRKHIMFVSWLGRSHMVPFLELLEDVKEHGHRVSSDGRYPAGGCGIKKVPCHLRDMYKPRAAESSSIGVPDAFWAGVFYYKQVTVVTSTKNTEFALDFGYKMSYVPDEVLRPLAARREKFFEKGYDELEKLGPAFLIREITIPIYAGIYRYLHGLLSSERPDLVLCDFMVDSCPDACDTLGLPYALTVSSIIPDGSLPQYLLDWWSSTPDAATTEGMGFVQRLQCKVLRPLQLLWHMRGPLQQLQAIKQQLGVVLPPGIGWSKPHALKLVNTFLGFEVPRPVDPMTMLVGPVCSFVNSSMPEDLEAWIAKLPAASASAAAGSAGDPGDAPGRPGSPRVVYVAFGTNVDVPPLVIAGMYEGLTAALDQGLIDGVIWAASATRSSSFPQQLHPRLLLLPFAPQKALLRHPAVKLFVSHGGAESSHEAMFAAKPMLVVPFFGDQPMNGAKLQGIGMARAIRHKAITGPVFLGLLQELLGSAWGSYAVAARRMQALARAHAATNKAHAGEMLRYYAEHGFQHLQGPKDRMPWWQASNADVYAALALAAVALLAAVVVVLWKGVQLLLLSGRSSPPSNKVKAA